MQKGKQWYNKLLQKNPYFENENYIGYDVGGFELGLQTNKMLFGKNYNKAKQQVGGNITYWGVANIKKELDRILQLEVEILNPIINVGDNILVADFFDPFGNIFGLIENPLFKIKI